VFFPGEVEEENPTLTMVYCATALPFEAL